MLRRATYPELWAGHGYPERPTLPALFGDVVHAALETILRAYSASSCTSMRDPLTVEVLRSLGGFSSARSPNVLSMIGFVGLRTTHERRIAWQASTQL